MSLGEFLTPSVEEWIDALGVEPQVDVSDEDVMRVAFTTAEFGDTMDLSYAPSGNSVQVRWLRHGSVLLDITREGARRLWVKSGQQEAYIGVDFEVEGLRGVLSLRILPSFYVKDSMLFV